MALAIQQVGDLQAIWLDDGSFGQVSASGWYAFLISVATAVGTSGENLTGLLDRHPELCADSDVLRLTRPTVRSARWYQLVDVYDAESGERDRQHKRKKKKATKRKRPAQNLTLYPLAVVAEVMNYYVGRGPCSVDQVAAVDALVAAGTSDASAGDDDNERGHYNLDDDGGGDEDDDDIGAALVVPAPRAGLDVGEEERAESKSYAAMKQESASYLDFHTVMEGARVLIDLTGPAANEGDDVLADALSGPLADNFLVPLPPRRQDAALKRGYRLPDSAISDRFKEQCIRFGEWRQRVYEWSRDEVSAAQITIGNNISNLLLFAGYCTTHAPAACRVHPPTAFDLTVFNSVAKIQPLALGYVQWLTQTRKVLYSTTLGYLNSLIVVANFYNSTLDGAAAGAFQATGGTHDAIAGLRRLRAHAQGQAKREKVQKPVHPHWLSWAVCQRARRRAARAFWERWDGAEGRALRAIYASLEKERNAGRNGDPRTLALRIARHSLFHSMQELVYLYLATITPPVRVSITRSLQFTSTFVKRRSDPQRYVIDLKNNPNSDAARHKTCATYRRAIFPCASIERMTELIDHRRRLRLSPEINTKRYVFVNQRGRPFTGSAWTGFAKRAFRSFGEEEEGESNSSSEQSPSSSSSSSSSSASSSSSIVVLISILLVSIIPVLPVFLVLAPGTTATATPGAAPATTIAAPKHLRDVAEFITVQRQRPGLSIRDAAICRRLSDPHVGHR
jgi:hypothetical protein